MSGARADEEYLALGYSRHPTAQPENNVVCELVRDRSRSIVRRLVVILFAQHLRVLWILDVVQPALHVQFVAIHRQVSEGDHTGIRWRISPRVELDICRRAELSQRKETGRHHVEYSRVFQVV